MRKAYPSDLTDPQWAIVKPLIPVHRVGRPRIHDMREILNAIFYITRAGCQWDMLPHDLPAKSTVYDWDHKKLILTWQFDLAEFCFFCCAMASFGCSQGRSNRRDAWT